MSYPTVVYQYQTKDAASGSQYFDYKFSTGRYRLLAAHIEPQFEYTVRCYIDFRKDRGDGTTVKVVYAKGYARLGAPLTLDVPREFEGPGTIRGRSNHLESGQSYFNVAWERI